MKQTANDDFLRLAGHQLRDPLTGIRWATDLLLERENLPVKQRNSYLMLINNSAKTLNDLITLLSNVSRIERGKLVFTPRSIDLVVFLGNLLKGYQPSVAEKRISLAFKEHPVQLPALIDTGALYNIVQSLISNAITYTPEKGKIAVALEAKKENFIVSVQDTGIGVPKADQKYIFRKFRRGSNAKQIKQDGLGLGLYAAAQTVKALRGKIWFESPAKEGKGTRFFVALARKPKSNP